MHQDHITIKLRHDRFLKTVCDTGIVYGLESDEGFSTSSSNDTEDENGEPVKMICFWSEKALANSCIKNGWADYRITAIPLSEFIENWCVGMNNDGLLIGTNFDQNMFGFEIKPFEVLLQLVQELKANQKNISFQKFDNLDDIEQQVKSAITGQ